MTARRDQEGQALVEFAFILPLLVIMLGGIVFCGSVVIQQERMAIVARAAARRLAIDGTQKSIMQGTPQSGSVQTAVSEAAGGNSGLHGTGLNWAGVTLGSGHPINTEMAYYARTGSITVGGKSYPCGVGCLLYGVKVEKNLGSDLSPFARLVDAFGGKLASITTISAVGVMPGDMPPSGNGGVLGINPWISRIVNMPDQ